MISVKCPGKVILSGEHAVVHGAPAIGCPIDLFTTCTIEEGTQGVTFHLKDLGETVNLSHPHIAPYTASLFFEKTQISPTPLSITIESDIPIGAGLGSSAALICSLIKALDLYYQTSLTESEIFDLSVIAESHQHGRSSGLDIAISLRGCPVLFEKGEIAECLIKFPPFKIANSGKRMGTTGAAVTHTTNIFRERPELLNEFREVTHELAKPQERSLFLELIKRNQALLEEIGVVPQKVQERIKTIEALGGAAKITGAGSISGDGAGSLLIFHL